MTHETLFENVGRLFFTRTRVRELEGEINAAGMNIPADSFAGYVALNVIIISVFLTILVSVYEPATNAIEGIFSQYVSVPLPLIILLVLIAALIAVYLATMALISTYLIMKTEDRKRKLEDSLPDFLTLVASNIKAGMTLDQAMWYSAKPEFGLLSTEVKAVIKKSFSGESLEDTLDILSARFDSRVFTRTILLLKQATATGGELTAVLERTANDVRNTIIMKKEIAASLVLYEIFVLFAAIVGTPFLFAVASRLINVFEKISSQAAQGGQFAGVGPLGAFSGTQFTTDIITSSDFFWFSIPTIFVTSLISSFIVSVIRTGSKSQGMKYFPFVLILAYIIYWVVVQFVDSFFGTIA